MAGVIDENGAQWEHCYRCDKYVRIEKLWYEYDAKNECRSQLCSPCAYRKAADTGYVVNKARWIIQPRKR